jgi:hypothetical protein
VRLSSGFFQTEISSTSSGPISYAVASSIGVGTGVGVGVGVGVTTTGTNGGVCVLDTAGVSEADADAAEGVSTTAASAGDEVVAESVVVGAVSSVAGKSVDVRGAGS